MKNSQLNTYRRKFWNQENKKRSQSLDNLRNYIIKTPQIIDTPKYEEKLENKNNNQQLNQTNTIKNQIHIDEKFPFLMSVTGALRAFEKPQNDFSNSIGEKNESNIQQTSLNILNRIKPIKQLSQDLRDNMYQIYQKTNIISKNIESILCKRGVNHDDKILFKTSFKKNVWSSINSLKPMSPKVQSKQYVRINKKQNYSQILLIKLQNLIKKCLNKIQQVGVSPELFFRKNTLYQFKQNQFQIKFEEAIKKSNMDLLYRMLHVNKILVYNVNHLKETGLHIAAKRNIIEVLILLLEYKSDYEFKDILGRTPLHVAIIYNNFESIQLLLAYGAQPIQLKLQIKYIKNRYYLGLLETASKIHVKLLQSKQKNNYKQKWDQKGKHQFLNLHWRYVISKVQDWIL